MQLKEFLYELPERFIARTPPAKRADSKMLVLRRDSGKCEIRSFGEIVDFLEKDDCIVINNSKVIRARILGLKNGAGAKIEFLLIRPMDSGRTFWLALARPAKRLALKSRVKLLPLSDDEKSEIWVECLGKNEDGTLTISLSGNDPDLMLERFGHVPLPPYIGRKDEAMDFDRYQTVYAKKPGSVAAPTAGLHFSEDILAKIAGKGVAIAETTLHVGPGTFLPVSTESILDHKMHSEHYELSAENADRINNAKKNGGRILAVGTTSVRVLETCSDENGFVRAGSGETNIFIYPPYKFKVPDMVLTNFHLPGSTLIMLVAAFAGRENVLDAYEFAKSADLRFYSYGDCMLIL